LDSRLILLKALLVALHVIKVPCFSVCLPHLSQVLRKVGDCASFSCLVVIVLVVLLAHVLRVVYAMFIMLGTSSTLMESFAVTLVVRLMESFAIARVLIVRLMESFSIPTNRLSILAVITFRLFIVLFVLNIL
jgi:hypothetical protein